VTPDDAAWRREQLLERAVEILRDKTVSQRERALLAVEILFELRRIQ